MLHLCLCGCSGLQNINHQNCPNSSKQKKQKKTNITTIKFLFSAKNIVWLFCPVLICRVITDPKQEAVWNDRGGFCGVVDLGVGVCEGVETRPLWWFHSDGGFLPRGLLSHFFSGVCCCLHLSESVSVSMLAAMSIQSRTFCSSDKPVPRVCKNYMHKV